MEIFRYRNLVVYQKAKELLKLIYKLIHKFPVEERYALCDQLRRASFSVTSNIAEGISRFSKKEKAHFLEISYGSLIEISSQLEIAMELKYITTEEQAEIDIAIEEVARMLAALHKKYKE